ncbi:replication initiation protein, partial [Shigella flexneri]|uniref:replication initiation protein n=1 Tax=Shigella flexneri TaxID=623 RepID=UPI0028526165
MNGTAHLRYALNMAARTADDASVKALKYAAAVERSLCEKLCADVNYSGQICKNPFRLKWLVMEWREEAYTLDELADYLPLSASYLLLLDTHYFLFLTFPLFSLPRPFSSLSLPAFLPSVCPFLSCFLPAVSPSPPSHPFPLARCECLPGGNTLSPSHPP